MEGTEWDVRCGSGRETTTSKALRTEQLSQTSDGMDRMGRTRRQRARALRIRVCTAGYEHGFTAYPFAPSAADEHPPCRGAPSSCVVRPGGGRVASVESRRCGSVELPRGAVLRRTMAMGCEGDGGPEERTSEGAEDAAIASGTPRRRAACAGWRRRPLQPRRRTAQRPRLSNIAAHSGDKLDDLPNEGGRALEIPRRSRPSAPAGHVKGNVRGDGERGTEQEWEGANSLGKYAD
ncbi:hypothetical protein BJ912DRAFT_546245 [Pholiota molesta]|nr:hypothetical protein BJ912DRAFT_546129 [Pholiota molesta]KAF8183712.1 hypothetical protein BJ912DRAFT_546245 [Pholiota molesta]